MTYLDRELIGRLVEREVESQMSWTQAAATSGVSRATFYRVKEGDPQITQRIYRKIERGIGLPFDTLTTVGVHDWSSLRSAGLSQELIEWLMKQANSSAPDASNTLRKRSQQAIEPGTPKR